MVEILLGLVLLFGLLVIGALQGGGLEWIREERRRKRERLAMLRVIQSAALFAALMPSLTAAAAKAVKSARDFEASMAQIQRTLDS